MIIPVDSSKTPFFRDINIDTHDIHHPGYTKLTSFCDFFGQSNLVKDKTCFTENHCSSIDVMLTDKTRCFQNTSVFETGLSDFHGMVLTLIGMGGGCFPPSPRGFSCRVFQRHQLCPPNLPDFY